jgi:hypothetical protein
MVQPYPSSGKPVEPERPPAPQSVQNAVKLMYAGAAVSTVTLVISLIIPLTDIAGSKASIKKAHPGLTASQVNHAFNVGITLAIVSGVIGTVLWLWMAKANSQGRNWARIASTVFFAFATLDLIGTLRRPSLFAGLFTVLIWLVGLGAVILLWRRENNDFYRPDRAGSLDAFVKPPSNLP